jgi:hypothetical protein
MQVGICLRRAVADSNAEGQRPEMKKPGAAPQERCDLS